MFRNVTAGHVNVTVYTEGVFDGFFSSYGALSISMTKHRLGVNICAVAMIWRALAFTPYIETANVLGLRSRACSPKIMVGRAPCRLPCPSDCLRYDLCSWAKAEKYLSDVFSTNFPSDSPVPGTSSSLYLPFLSQIPSAPLS